MPDAKQKIALELNGEAVEVAFAPHKTLLEVLRDLDGFAVQLEGDLLFGIGHGSRNVISGTSNRPVGIDKGAVGRQLSPSPSRRASHARDLEGGGRARVRTDRPSP